MYEFLLLINLFVLVFLLTNLLFKKGKFRSGQDLYQLDRITDRIQSLADERVPFGLVMIDIINFNAINSKYGYAVGDKVLIRISRILKEMTHFYDVGHLRSDRFLMLINSESNLESLSKLLDHKLSKITLDKIDFHLSGSMGVAYNEEGINTSDLIRNAEAALLSAKMSEFEDIHVYSDTDSICKNGHLIFSLRDAIDNDEIYLEFQPIYSSLSNQVVGYESLARWASNKHGKVPPNVFIELAEKNGLIHEIGQLITLKALNFIKTINEYNPSIYVTINVSPFQLYKPDYVNHLIEKINELKINPRNVAIEITETIYMKNIQQAKTILKTLRMYGIRIFVDDFGTGYSSLSQIRDLPLDVIKVDKSFVDQMDHEDDMFEIFMSIAKKFDLSIVAEGVEKKVQYQKLQNYGCHLLQGYYLSKPLTYDHALSLMK
ncbi:bifunctional diguanylate cyclase/phosphodiesterase [Acidaminobacter sp. JC074]|uniref:putative bifunctional diguanylate cyclase/phosphodiesterase n=1 Tax=Acidaminobacter sp. JC074 TaxID=2530199 RepID=UPI001F0E57E3|nr:bifunctional diguanylate cyclase/phosphodiesterase [Acidaminobacter sp. JC074]MCH4886427.1 bifunctional diguanylate cyclase/phosphodiesterase [Acidaminobacter sp. JC074]